MTTRAALAFVLLALGFALSGCGLSPVYGNYSSAKNTAVASQFDSVYIDVIPDRSGQKLRNQLMDRFYKTGRKSLADAAYRLEVVGLTESIYGLGIAKDATATRSQIKYTAQLNLYSRADTSGKPVLTRNLTAVSSFNTLASQYTTLVTEQDARDQTISELADQVTTMMELYFSNPAAFPKPKDKLLDPDAKESAADRMRREHDLENEYNQF